MKTLVVLPSWGRDAYAYKKLLETKPNNYNIYILSYKEICPDNKKEYIENNIITFLKSKKITSVELLGHSLGGAIALHFASNHPQYVSKLILVDTKAFPEQYYLRNIFKTQMQNLRITKDLKFAFYIVFITAIKILWNFKLYKMLGMWALTFDVTKFSEKISIKTIIFWGENDKSIPLSLGKRLHSLLPTSTLIIIPSGNHEWILHSPEYLWKALAEK